MNAHAIVTAGYNFAKVCVVPDPHFLQLLQLHGKTKMQGVDARGPAGASEFVWTFANMGVLPTPEFLAALQKRVDTCLKLQSPQRCEVDVVLCCF
jgi:hypothetical protein